MESDLNTRVETPLHPLAPQSPVVAPEAELVGKRTELPAEKKKGRYLFDPEKLHQVARGAIGMPHAEMVRFVSDELERAYPRYIDKDVPWIYNITAGATGIMKILHASIREYVLIFGTPIGTEGFSGRYRMDIYDFQMAGETWTYTEEDFAERKVCKPGDVMFLRKGIVKGFRIQEDGWMLEYARGFIPAALPLALGDSVFSSMDGTTIVKTLWHYGKLVTKNLFRGKL
jgi:ERG2 and Sigma1 receptor like protein